MDLEYKKLTELTFYCYTRLKSDELGLVQIEGVSSPYAPYYAVLDVESELLFRPLDDVIPLRCEWDKAKKDFQKYSKVFLSDLSEKVCWSGMVGLTAIAKMFIRRYRAVNPLFASMICVELLEAMNELSDNKATAMWITWRKIARRYVETKKDTPKHNKNIKEIYECCVATLLAVGIVVVVTAGCVKLAESLP